MSLKDISNKRAVEMFDQVAAEMGEDIEECLRWARETLTEHEGGGHCFQIHATNDGCFQFSFAKPSWGGDHVSGPMYEAGEAVIMGVCEYLNGM